MSVILMTPQEVAKQVSKQARERRLSINLSQKSLSERSGVSNSVIKKFESTGQISFESLLKIAFILESVEPFKDLFIFDISNVVSLDKLLKDKKRKRGRK